MAPRRDPREEPSPVIGNAPDPAAVPFALEVWRMQVHGEDYALFTFPVGREDVWRTLTPRERVVATEVLRGLSNASIAQQLHVTPRTVANQVATIFRKVGVHSRAELAAHYSSSLDP